MVCWLPWCVPVANEPDICGGTFNNPSSGAFLILEGPIADCKAFSMGECHLKHSLCAGQLYFEFPQGRERSSSYLVTWVNYGDWLFTWATSGHKKLALLVANGSFLQILNGQRLGDCSNAVEAHLTCALGYTAVMYPFLSFGLP